MSTPLRKKSANTVIWVLMALLILGLGGFGVTNFGGGVRSIGSVGDREIGINDYARALRRELNAFSAQVGQQVSFAQAQTLGIDRSVQGQVLASAALDNEAARIGISVGDGAVGERIVTLPAFQGLDGKFSRDAYSQALRQEGLTEAEFETKLREEASRTLLQGAVMGATGAPEVFVDKLTAWANESRSFTLAQLLPSDLTEPTPEPTNDELIAYHTAKPDLFTSLETRKITYAWLAPENLLSEVEVDEAALQGAYQDRIDEYVRPETRLVERLVYPSEEEAKVAKARFDAGDIGFDGLAAERGLTLPDIDLGEMSKEALGAAGEAVFALEAPGVVGPVQTDLGPALFSMNGILEAEEVTFDEARDDLVSEVGLDRARRLVAERSNEIEDLLAGGATLENLAAEAGMTIASLDYTSDSEGGIAAYPEFRQAAGAATTEDFPELVALEDGGIFALRLDALEPPALRPFNEVRAEVAAAWSKDKTHESLVALGQEILAQLENGATLEELGLVTTNFDELARGGHVSDTPEIVGTKVFEIAAGDHEVIDDGNAVFVVALHEVHPADAASEEVTQFRDAAVANVSQEVARDTLELYTQAIEQSAGIKLNPAAIDAVHAQLQ